MNTDQELRNDKAMFDAYVSLREIAQKYQLEDKLGIPRVVFVGETSSGKSMLVQNFLRFPCAFSQSDIGTRCPILYRLRYNPSLADDVILVKHPADVQRAEDLSDHLRQEMERIERTDGFRLQEYLVHIESKHYRDFEILDVPGLIGGARDGQHARAVECIVEHYVRDPTFLIVRLKEATQLGVNSFGTKRVRDFCLEDPAPCGSTLPPRLDYENYTITIQTKFDLFMNGHPDGTEANKDMNNLIEYFDQQTLFVSMIFDTYNFGNHNYKENADYIAALPELESEHVDNWIRGMSGFNRERYRPFIGINLVRNRIQDMWVQAFRTAVPKIQQVLNELVKEQKFRYETVATIVEEKDLNTTRDMYQRYIQSFRHILSDYVVYRAEINSQFEFAKYSRTYRQIEDEYNRWSRKHPLHWSAYQSAEQLAKEPLERLDSLSFRYIGAIHFERIRKVFFYMILTYQPINRQRDWFETSCSLLHGVNADNENLEKGIRELLYTYIRETFLMGICWLTQMYSFLLEHFEQHVTSVLLSPTGEFAALGIGHEKFLSCVRLEYHQTTRSMIRRAIEASRNARYAKMVYVTHNICQFLRTLAQSFPPTIANEQKKEIPIACKHPNRLIFNSGIFLPEDRNSESGNCLLTTRNVATEIYSAVRGLLLHDITTNFFANVVIEVQQYKSIQISDALESRIEKMSNEEIAHLSQIDYNKHIRELNMIYDQLIILEKASDEIEHASRLFDGKTTIQPTGKVSARRNLFHEKRDHRHQAMMEKLYEVKDKDTENEVKKDCLIDHQVKNDEYQLKIANNDPQSCEQCLLELFQKHDIEDLKLGFLRGDDFQVNRPEQTHTQEVTSATPLIQAAIKDNINDGNRNAKPPTLPKSDNSIQVNNNLKGDTDKSRKNGFNRISSKMKPSNEDI